MSDGGVRSRTMSDTEESRDLRAYAETAIEWVVFNSRWLLAPLYLGLVAALAMLLWKFGQTFWDVSGSFPQADLRTATVDVLELLDIVLLGNLVVIVIFVGYENFVSKIGISEGHEDRPRWLGHLGFSGMKLKLIGSIVAISMIELLRDFIAPTDNGYRNEGWRIGLHVVFVISGLLFALTDFLATRAVENE